MPRLIQHIDAISRSKKRDVLWVFFGSYEVEEGIKYLKPADLYYEHNLQRVKVIEWLTENNISYEPCGYHADESCMRSYDGQLYVDIPFDRTDPIYLKLERYLEKPDGSMRLPGVIFMATSYEKALANRHHDEPGFWERWAETF
ncbi:hypothetical protein [Neptuniibacter sp. QD48_11]|uniref:hypothetical protein n=1 Tax=Neptuniibacter sp. QD48_11 TaxID=3398211 RepID=UPI0039F590AC